ncbi:MAG: nucleotide-binding protein [Chloroflexi bacterium]|nr:nucleotide-binding protein [Chloroflexota bacterium]
MTDPSRGPDRIRFPAAFDMRIAIFGSSSTTTKVGDGIVRRAELEQLCLDLGAALAAGRHAILVESDRERTADRLVVQGLLNAQHPLTPEIRVYHRPGRGEPPFAAQARGASVAFRHIPLRGSLLSPSHFRMLREADVAIVVGGGGHAYPAGLAAFLMGVRLIPVATFGGAGRLLWQELSDHFDRPLGKLPRRSRWDRLAGEPQDVVDAIREELESLPRVMIVHGRSDDRVKVEEILVSCGVRDPIVLQRRLHHGTTIPEKFESEASQADAAVVLFTPDDEAEAMKDSFGQPIPADNRQKRARARQNVSLEYGWFWGRLGRDRLLMMVTGNLELPTDLSGLLFERYEDSPDERRAEIVAFIDSIRYR